MNCFHRHYMHFSQPSTPWFNNINFKRSYFFENVMLCCEKQTNENPMIWLNAMKLLWVCTHEIVWWHFHSITQHDYAVKLPWYLLIPIEYNPLKLHVLWCTMILCCNHGNNNDNKFCIVLWRIIGNCKGYDFNFMDVHLLLGIRINHRTFIACEMPTPSNYGIFIPAYKSYDFSKPIKCILHSQL